MLDFYHQLWSAFFEGKINFMQRDYPQFLPVTRAEVTLLPKPGDAAGSALAGALSPARPPPERIA